MTLELGKNILRGGGQLRMRARALTSSSLRQCLDARAQPHMVPGQPGGAFRSVMGGEQCPLLVFGLTQDLRLEVPHQGLQLPGRPPACTGRLHQVPDPDSHLLQQLRVLPSQPGGRAASRGAAVPACSKPGTPCMIVMIAPFHLPF